MANVSNYALRLQSSLLKELRQVAKDEGTTINQLINVAVAEKLASLRTEEYFRQRAQRGDLEKFSQILDKAGQSDFIQEGDEILE